MLVSDMINRKTDFCSVLREEWWMLGSCSTLRLAPHYIHLMSLHPKSNGGDNQSSGTPNRVLNIVCQARDKRMSTSKWSAKSEISGAHVGVQPVHSEKSADDAERLILMRSPGH